jgi:hypothetical protein
MAILETNTNGKSCDDVRISGGGILDILILGRESRNQELYGSLLRSFSSLTTAGRNLEVIHPVVIADIAY